MSNNLVIVESPAKAKTIERFLGDDFKVMSSFGHVRDLADKGLGIDFTNNYAPHYEVSTDKKKVVAELNKEVKKANTVWLASDEDREGEAIAWHLYEVLKLQKKDVKRIVFHEITKDAILKAVENPREIDSGLVDAQQARRVLDRIVGFELSPVLWKKVRPSLSAGRVQSVAVRLIVEREREIQAFKAKSTYRVSAIFQGNDVNGKPVELKAELNHRFESKQEANAFLEECKTSDFEIGSIVKRPAKKSPSAPFTTSTLQQEASRKLGYSVAQTMRVAQSLYEAGKITYMRTDSVNLSNLAIATSKEEIRNMAGEEYVKIRKFSTKSKGAQEAHEAIRPTYIAKHAVSGSAQEKRLYELIWKRTIASQMADAKMEKTTITIQTEKSKYKFTLTGEVIVFDGFLKVYLESKDDDSKEAQNPVGILPKMKQNEPMDYSSIVAQERFSLHPPRYTEASLVRKMEELGIGRPSTYAPTISTIQKRQYVEKADRPPIKQQFVELTLTKGEVVETTKTENTGEERSKMFPTDIGTVVNDFLMQNFQDIMNYDFTAQVEKEFDNIAEGNQVWYKAIDQFYKDFHPTVEHTLAHSERQVGERILGIDPKTGRQLSVKIGRFGPLAQIGTVEEEEKPTFASLLKGQSIESITFEEALELFRLPRELEENYEDEPMTVAIGRFGPYIRHKGTFYSIPKTDDPHTIKVPRAIEIIEAKREVDRNKIINVFGENEEIQVLNGRYGPYVAFDGNNYKIPKTTEAKGLTIEDCKKLIEEQKDTVGKKGRAKTTRRTTTTKKSTTRKTKKTK